MTDINDVIAERIEQARRRVEQQRADRARRQAARTAGKAKAHAARIAHWAAMDNTSPSASGA